VKTSKNGQNFDFRLNSYFENFEKWPKLQEMTKTSRNELCPALRAKLRDLAKTSRNDENFEIWPWRPWGWRALT
jgi:hypothetical protein